MKTTKTIVSVILAIVILGSMAVCAFGADVIGVESAKSIALKHAGLSAQDVIFTKAQLDRDDGTKQYEIEFYAGAYEYDYDINAYTGKIHSYDKEYDDDRNAPAPAPEAVVKPSADYIGIEAAKTAALTHAGVAEKDARFVKAQLDFDDGAALYEVEFYVGKVEYDYDINAITGKVVSFDKDFENDVPAAPVSSAEPAAPAPTPDATPDAKTELISVDEAKQIAIDNAGLTASEVKFKKARLDYDDGVAHYDIEFKVGTTKEYDYEIDALTGTITDFDYDVYRISIFVFLGNLFNRIFGR